jgi:hypothetical protein
MDRLKLVRENLEQNQQSQAKYCDREYFQVNLSIVWQTIKEDLV